MIDTTRDTQRSNGLVMVFWATLSGVAGPAAGPLQGTLASLNHDGETGRTRVRPSSPRA